MVATRPGLHGPRAHPVFSSPRPPILVGVNDPAQQPVARPETEPKCQPPIPCNDRQPPTTRPDVGVCETITLLMSRGHHHRFAANLLLSLAAEPDTAGPANCKVCDRAATLMPTPDEQANVTPTTWHDRLRDPVHSSSSAGLSPGSHDPSTKTSMQTTRHLTHMTHPGANKHATTTAAVARPPRNRDACPTCAAGGTAVITLPRCHRCWPCFMAGAKPGRLRILDKAPCAPRVDQQPGPASAQQASGGPLAACPRQSADGPCPTCFPRPLRRSRHHQLEPTGQRQSWPPPPSTSQAATPRPRPWLSHPRVSTWNRNPPRYDISAARPVEPYENGALGPFDHGLGLGLTS